MEHKLKSGKIVSKLRSDLGMTQSVFAQKIGITQSYISQVERDRKDISLSLFIEWCASLGLKEISIGIKNKAFIISYR